LMVPDFAISAAAASFPETMAKHTKTAHTRPLCRCIKLFFFLPPLYFLGDDEGRGAPATTPREGLEVHVLVCFIAYLPTATSA
jgi:hypothetical protein